MTRDVFVSYSQPDHDCAFEIVARLEAQQVSTWIAPRDIAPAADWAAEIIDGISSARLMLLVFSSHSNESPQVLREVERAVHKRIPVLPFRVENLLPTRSLEYFLSTQHWLDAFSPPMEPHYQKLCAYISAQLGGVRPVSERPASRPAPAPAPVHISIDAMDLVWLEQQLAHYIGPMAKHLVKRAAAKATDWEQFTLQLASEVSSDRERSEFISACRALTRRT
ncbi:MAG: toll/interleukin-1 receptor domain-containing protein [Gammaproteobacteria bacterium]